MPAKLENSAVATGLGKVSFLSSPKEVQCQRMFIALIPQASSVMLKILQAGFQKYVNHEIPDVQPGLEKAEEPEMKLSISSGSSTEQESSRKYLLLLY